MRVSLDEFWDKLGDPRTVRLDKLRCAIGNEIYETEIAPEDVPGFIEGKIDHILELLGPVNPTRDAIVFSIAYFLCYAIPAAIAVGILYATGIL